MLVSTWLALVDLVVVDSDEEVADCESFKPYFFFLVVFDSVLVSWWVAESLESLERDLEKDAMSAKATAMKEIRD